MLPPQLRSSLPATGRSTCNHNVTQLSQARTAGSVTVSSQSRTFWSWRRPNDYASHIDPLYHRFNKYRTMKTKAKLIEKLRRRGRFEWDADQRPFFAPRHIRWASFYNGKPVNVRWVRDLQEEDAKKKRNKPAVADDGHELSQREREWKEQMELLRKRVEQDPYEAVFGKRFEPFWSPLVPSWMREEMGLQGWPKSTLPASKSKASEEVVVTTAKAATKPADSQTSASKAATDSSDAAGVRTESEPKKATGTTQEASAYASVSSTSWDSWTNKTRRTEWDSASGETKSWEYDPISNRMVQIASPTAVASNDAKPRAVPDSQASSERHSDMQSLINTPRTEPNPTAVKLPPTTSNDVRKAIPIPQQPVQTEHVMKCTAASSPKAGSQKISSPPKPAALASLPKSDLDLLTADNVRASMGKVKPPSSIAKPTTPAEKAAMEASFDSRAASLSEQEELQAISQIVDKSVLDDYVASVSEAKYKLRKRFHEHVVKTDATDRKLETSLDRFTTPKTHETATPSLQPALDRMQSTESCKLAELDDAAAHESTEPIPVSSVPSNWSSQADVLQAERVKRTSGKQPYPMTRWTDDMEARKAAYEAAKPNREADKVADEKRVRLEKANALLEAEVKQQKFLMQSHENRYAHKIRSLRQELEAAYKQSAVHSEMHLDRIESLKTELGKAQKAAGGSSKPDDAVHNSIHPLHAGRGEGDFCVNVIKYADSNKWYKRPAVASPTKMIEHDNAKAEQKARDTSLVKQVRAIYENAYGSIDTNHRQQAAKPIKKNPVAELLERKNKPKQVVEVESDVDLGDALAKHENEQSYRFKSDSLEDELKDEDREVQKLQVANEVAAEEIKAHEAQQMPEKVPAVQVSIQHSVKPSQATPTSHAEENAAELRKRMELATKDRSRLEATKKAASESNNDVRSLADDEAAQVSVQWKEPPVYKVLAYDSGNDTFSTATTSSNFAGTETPISIPEALSKLYQPARFVSHFADLQKDGYQVIYATRDLLVFKKVKTVEPVSAEQPAQLEQGEASLIDHGLIKPMENALAEEAANFYDRYKPEPPPYDPTSIENGKLMPYENALAQEAADYHDQRMAIINPIDGTTRSQKEPVSTGNFASPTGFVNHDPVFPPEASGPEAKLSKKQRRRQQREAAEAQKAAERIESDRREATSRGEQYEDVDYAHYPRVRREEPVFSGTRRTGRGWNDRHERHQVLAEEQRLGRRRTRGGAFKWALGVGIGSAGVAYAFGVAAEAARARKIEAEKERWQQIVEGKRRWWD